MRHVRTASVALGSALALGCATAQVEPMVSEATRERYTGRAAGANAPAAKASVTGGASEPRDPAGLAGFGGGTVSPDFARAALDPDAVPAWDPSGMPFASATLGDQRYLPDDGSWFGPEAYTASVVLGSLGIAALEGGDFFENAGDLLQITLPLGALGATYLEDDAEGRVQFAESFATSWLTVRGLKLVAEKARPNSSNAESFPSGHTQSAFAGASFLGSRYGWKTGLISYTGAVLTGLSRVDAQAHFMDDVLAGASFSLLANWLFVTPISESAEIAPVVTDDGYGVSVRFRGSNPRTQNLPTVHAKQPFVPRGRYSFEFGGAWQEKNLVQSPPAGSPMPGTQLDFSSFDGTSNPTTTAQGTLELYFGDERRHQVLISFWPFEARDNANFGSPVSFGGATYSGAVRSAYRLYDLRAWYRYELLPDSRWDLAAGAGLSYQDLTAALSDGTQTTDVEDIVWLPFVHLHAGYAFNDKWSLWADGSGISTSEDTMADAAAFVEYRIDERWDVSLGYRLGERQLDIDTIDNDFRVHRISIGIGYSF